MKKYTFTKIAALLLAFIFIPASVHAAEIYVESSRTSISVGDTAIITVKVNSEADTLNAFEGDIAVSKNGQNFLIQEFSLAGSSFGLWPRTPSLSTDGQLISFVGGIPGGFKEDGAVLFKIILEAKNPGTISLTPKNISAYASDGKGTKIPVDTKGLTLEIKPRAAGASATNDWTNIVTKDITPPENFVVLFGRDPSIFEGKKFAFFTAVDTESGIDYYEVSEAGAAVVRSGSMYVLRDQNGEPELKVTAYDKAGNKKEGSISSPGGSKWYIYLIIVVVIAAAVVIWKIKKRNA